MKIIEARHIYPESAGFSINRPRGFNNYIVFVHFLTEVDIILDGKKQHVEPHTCVIYDRTYYQNWTTSVPLVHDWMHIDGDVEAYMEKYGLKFNTPYRLNNSGFVTELVNDIEVEFFRRRKYMHELCSTKLEQLFIGISRNLSETSDIDSERKNDFEKLRLTVFSDLAKKWTVQDMAKLVAMSPSRFFTVYKSVFGVSPMNDLIKARIHAAKFHLTNSELSVGEIAEIVGYSNEYHFIRQFRKVTGVSPGKYIKRIGNK